MTLLATQNSSVINRASPFAKSLWYAFLPGLGQFTGRTARDLSGYHRHGDFQDAASWSSYTGGVGFGSVALDGVDDHIDLTTFNLPRPSTQIILVKFNTLDGTTDAQPTVLHAGNHYLAIDGANDQVQFFNGAWRNSTATVTTNTLHCIGYSGSTSQSRMFLDGVKVYDAATGIATTGAGIEIGARADALSSPFTTDGNIVGAFIYDVELSDSQHAAFYREARRGFTSLLNHVPFRRDVPAAPSIVPERGVKLRRIKRISHFPSSRVTKLPAIKRVSVHRAD